MLATVGVSRIEIFSPLTPAIVGDSTPLVSSLASATVLLWVSTKRSSSTSPWIPVASDPKVIKPVVRGDPPIV
jgi:hypothetical protein